MREDESTTRAWHAHDSPTQKRNRWPKIARDGQAATPLHAAQASAQHEMAEWMQVIQNGTAACLGSLGVRASAREEEAALPVVREVAGNGACADCGAPAPTWASINLGVTICLACAGVHRRLGTHLSKVCARSSRTRLAWPCPRGTPLAADTKTHASSSQRCARSSWTRASGRRRSWPSWSRWATSASTAATTRGRRPVTRPSTPRPPPAAHEKKEMRAGFLF